MDSNIILYTTDSGSVSVQVQYEDGTFWLTQKRMAELFGVDVRTVNYHLKEIFQSNELQEDSVIRKIRITALDGKNYLTNFYHLDQHWKQKSRLNTNTIHSASYKTKTTFPILTRKSKDLKGNDFSWSETR